MGRKREHTASLGVRKGAERLSGMQTPKHLAAAIDGARRRAPKHGGTLGRQNRRLPLADLARRLSDRAGRQNRKLLAIKLARRISARSWTPK